MKFIFEGPVPEGYTNEIEVRPVKEGEIHWDPINTLTWKKAEADCQYPHLVLVPKVSVWLNYYQKEMTREEMQEMLDKFPNDLYRQGYYSAILDNFDKLVSNGS